MSNDQELNLDAMSDEEINNLTMPEDDVVEEEVPAEPEAEEETGEEVDDVEVSEEGEESGIASESVEEGAEDESSEESDTDDSGEAPDDAEDEGDVEVNSEVNALEELLKTPLKVGDTEITINSLEDLVTLAKRGVGSNKRMQELAPKLKTLSMLESNGLLDQNKLNFLIALDKKDPAAIRKLVASSGVDTFDASTGNADEDYTAPDYSITDEEYAVEQAFESIKLTDSFDSTIKTLQGYDESSKAEIRKDPVLLRQLNEHHGNGVYQEIQNIVATEQALGRLEGLSEFAAYKHVWNTVQEHSARTQGTGEAGHKNLTGGQPGREQLAGSGGNREAANKTKSGKQVGNAQAAAKKAAESTNKNRGSQQVDTINIDDLTDEEIMALDVNSL